MFEELKLNFSKISDLKPDDIHDRMELFGSFLDDRTISAINKRRYTFYKNFYQNLGDPKLLKKFMYNFKTIAKNRKSRDNLLKNIIKEKELLTKVGNTEADDYLKVKSKRIEDVNDNLYKILSKDLELENNLNNEQKESKNDMLKEIFGNKMLGGNKELLDDYSTKIENVMSNNKDIDDVKVAKLNDIFNDMENVIDPEKVLNITKEDRIIFIILTFILRVISLSFVDWALNTNYINNFQQAFIFYAFLYILLLLIITILVNITYSYSINSIKFGTTGFSNLVNALYYFYIIPGGGIYRNARLIVHILFILIFLSIPILIKNNQENIDEFDYVRKKQIKNVLGNFTLVIWLFTSMISINY